MTESDLPMPARIADANGLFAGLRARCRDDWRAYVRHEFVQRLGRGTLPEAAFRHYLVQDYLFLFQFARAYALAAYKAESLAELRRTTAALNAIADTEMRLHVEYCAGWGIDEAALAAAPEATATLAYTRFVLECGAAGDLLDLHVALSPCAIGYAEIGLMLADDPATRTAGNPYRPWIEMYSGDEFVAVARAQADELDRLFAARGGAGRLPALERIFRRATRLEAAFWQMGLALES